jgi:hypothetical protein
MATLGAADDAVAQAGAAAPASAVAKQADAHSRKANQLYAEKKWAEAEGELLAAWALNPTYDVGSNLGHTQYRLGKYRDAAEHLDFALRHWPLIGKPEPRKLAEERLAEVRGMVGALRIEVKAEHAELYVDGKRVGQSPMTGEVFVEAGAHRVEARHELYGVEAIGVTATKGATVPVRLGLGEVAPVVVVPVVPGGGAPRGWRPPTALVVASGVLAAGGIAAGAGLTVAANGRASRALDLGANVGGSSACYGGAGSVGDCKTLHETLASKSAFATGATTGFAIGSALALVTTGLAVWEVLPKRRADAFQMVPVGSPSGAGLQFSGRW